MMLVLRTLFARRRTHHDEDLVVRSDAVASPDDKAKKAMGAMEETLGDLQDELIIATEPPRKHFKPVGLLLVVLVVLLVGGGTYLTASTLREAPEDAKTVVDENCQVRNEKLTAVNEKFHDLSLVVDFAMVNRPADAPPVTPAVLEALEDLKKPIALVDCEEEP